MSFLLERSTLIKSKKKEKYLSFEICSAFQTEVPEQGKWEAHRGQLNYDQWRQSVPCLTIDFLMFILNATVHSDGTLKYG